MFLRSILVAVIMLNGLFCVASSASSEMAVACRGKKILWVDSYHEGYAWSDGIERGIRDALEGLGVVLKIWRMDTKRNPSDVYSRNAGRRAKAIVEKFRPDVVIASDDNAQKYLVLPYLKDIDLSVVFCGVNSHPTDYGYPCGHVTGMCETDYIESLVRQMRSFAGGDRIGLLTGDTESERIVAHRYQQLFGNRLKIYWVRTFVEYQQSHLRAQQEVDMLCLGNNAGIADWDATAAEVFTTKNIRIPIGTVSPWMKKLAIFTLAKVPEEQGEYAAATALRILAGTQPADIPLRYNKLAHLTVNLKMAQAAGIVVPVSLLQMAEVVGQEALHD